MPVLHIWDVYTQPKLRHPGLVYHHPCQLLGLIPAGKHERAGQQPRQRRRQAAPHRLAAQPAGEMGVGQWVGQPQLATLSWSASGTGSAAHNQYSQGAAPGSAVLLGLEFIQALDAVDALDQLAGQRVEALSRALGTCPPHATAAHVGTAAVLAA